jgi:mannose-6-phosphate isomerase
MNCIISLLAVAGHISAEGDTSDTTTDLAVAKVVRKHWGEERWLVDVGSPFGFKIIIIRSGKRTSLQYHNRKEEANLVLYGKGLLQQAENDSAPLIVRTLMPGQIAHIRPGVIHRVEALSDLVMVEVSSPELDDVIRLQDDMGRGGGRIAAEHQG